MTTLFLTVWVIYRSPLDHPGKFVLRAQDVFRGQTEPVPRRECRVCDSLEEARRALPEMQMYQEDGRTYGAEPYRLDRQPSDDPTIVETWI